MSNSDNPRIGARFQEEVKEWFEYHYAMPFELEVKIPIGSRLLDRSQYKNHKFDIVSEDRSIVIECKCYSWTESGNVPSAKMGFVNEAAFYLSLVNGPRKKIIVMLQSSHPKQRYTLADYYYHTNYHLLGDVIVAQYDPHNKAMIFLNEDEVEIRWKRRVNRFASRYLDLFQSKKTTEEMLGESFGEECFELGFQMDCFNAFIEAYGIENPNDTNALKSTIGTIDDVDILCSAIFSKWRYITHWSEGESCMDSDNREWFIVAFNQLLELT